MKEDIFPSLAKSLTFIFLSLFPPPSHPQSVSSQEALGHRKSSVCVPRALGQLFILLQYQTLAQRIKVMVRKAENLAKLTRIPGAPGKGRKILTSCCLDDLMTHILIGGVFELKIK